MRNVPPDRDRLRVQEARQSQSLDEYEEHLQGTWEERYLTWCRERSLDPEDTDHPRQYDEWWMNNYKEQP